MTNSSSDPGTVRRARADDAARVAALYARLVTNPGVDVQATRLAELEADPRSALFVFERDGALLGTVLVALCADAMFGARPFAVVENVIIADDARASGVGRALMHEAEAFCAAAGCSKIMLLSAAHRHGAHAFFEACGYDAASKRGFVKYARAFTRQSRP